LANQSYLAANERAPRHPLISLERARLERSEGKVAEARQFFDEALSRKSNYAQALFELSLLEIQEDNVEEDEYAIPDDDGELIDVDADEDVPVLIVGDPGPVGEGDEGVRLPGHSDRTPHTRNLRNESYRIQSLGLVDNSRGGCL